MSLHFALSESPATDLETGCLILGLFDGSDMPPATADVDRASGGLIAHMLESRDLSGKAGKTAMLHRPQGIKAERLLVVGLGKAAEFDAHAYRRALDSAFKALKNGPAAHAACALTALDVPGHQPAWRVRQAVLAADAQAYRYTATRKENGEAKQLERVSLMAPGGSAEALAQGEAIAAGVRFARELGNLPPNICNPAYIAEQAQGIASDHEGVSCEILETPEMENLGMGSLLSVARGSANTPRLVVLRWNGGDAGTKPFALVGKGITFDTGGISLKPGPGMEEMKFDMCGAAGVLGAFLGAVKLKLPLNLVCVVAAVENMPDGNAYRPSDVITAMDGQTIEVLNTDAEGRLILCDALTYVQRFEPAAIVDAATLTGACVVALGKHATGLMSRSDDLAAELLAAGETSLDRAWRLPLWTDYDKQLESAFADVANIGGKWAGAITAGCFLARFAKGQRWAHLDVAGTAWEEGRKGLATGRPVPLLVSWLIDRASA
ncbi:MAG TPA: leucyl aminopeptidase [Xanthomonadaceae bacterium]|nr:leucyl aminopeptidase [Xanthomonadaceae bacterium]